MVPCYPFVWLIMGFFFRPGKVPTLKTLRCFSQTLRYATFCLIPSEPCLADELSIIVSSLKCVYFEVNMHCISILILPIHANTCCLESLDWNSGVLRLVEKGQDLKAITDVIADLRRRHKKAPRIHLSLVETVRAGLDETTTLVVGLLFSLSFVRHKVFLYDW